MQPDHTHSSDDYDFYLACTRLLGRERMARIFRWRSITGLAKRVRPLSPAQRPVSQPLATAAGRSLCPEFLVSAGDLSRAIRARSDRPRVVERTMWLIESTIAKK